VFFSKYVYSSTNDRVLDTNISASALKKITGFLEIRTLFATWPSGAFNTKMATNPAKWIYLDG